MRARFDELVAAYREAAAGLLEGRDELPASLNAETEAIRDEIEAHLEIKTQELMAQGLSPEDARQEALRRFGPMEEIQEEARRYARARSRQEQRGAILEGLSQDLRFDGPGLLAMANSGPKTNGSQFFVTLAATPWLNDKHTIFGEVLEGMDVVTAIGKTEVGPGDKPVSEVRIESMSFETRKIEE